MILADKIISLRKRRAGRRRSWRSSWAYPGSRSPNGRARSPSPIWIGSCSWSRLFGVTTDDLLKDEIEEFGPAAESDEPALRRMTMEQSAQYLVLRRKAAPQMALAAPVRAFRPSRC